LQEYDNPLEIKIKALTRGRLLNNTGIFDLILIKKFEKEIVFESTVLAGRIRIEQKCWIRIRIKSIRIHNPARKYVIFLVTYMLNQYRVLEKVKTPKSTGGFCTYEFTGGYVRNYFIKYYFLNLQ
jgi:hypothetical protein